MSERQAPGTRSRARPSDAGTRLVWVVEPRGRTVTVYRSRDDIRILTSSQEIDGGEVLPSFRIEVSEFFAD